MLPTVDYDKPITAYVAHDIVLMANCSRQVLLRLDRVLLAAEIFSATDSGVVGVVCSTDCVSSRSEKSPNLVYAVIKNTTDYATIIHEDTPFQGFIVNCDEEDEEGDVDHAFATETDESAVTPLDAHVWTATSSTECSELQKKLDLELVSLKRPMASRKTKVFILFDLPKFTGTRLTPHCYFFN